MPEKTNVDITPLQLRKGDLLVIGALRRPIVNIDRKVKYVYVTLETEDRPRKFETDERITVEREVATAEETRDRQRQYVIRQLRDMLTKWLNDPAEALEREIVKNREGNYRMLVDYSELNTFLKGQAFWKIAREIDASMKRIAATETAIPDAWREGDELLLTGWASWYLYTTERRSFPSDPLSRSTSVTSNLLEDMDKWALEQVQHDLRNYVGLGSENDWALGERIAEVREAYGC